MTFGCIMQLPVVLKTNTDLKSMSVSLVITQTNLIAAQHEGYFISRTILRASILPWLAELGVTRYVIILL